MWASANVLNSWDTGGLLAQSSQPLMLTFNCLNGYFLAPNYDSLSEAVSEGGGTGVDRGVLPSGLSLDGPAHKFHRALMAEITNGTHERLGDAVLAAQAAYAKKVSCRSSSPSLTSSPTRGWRSRPRPSGAPDDDVPTLTRSRSSANTSSNT